MRGGLDGGARRRHLLSVNPDIMMIQAATPSIYDRLTALADSTRSRMLLLLDRHELTVGDLAAALQLPQSTTSRHLKILSDEGWLVSRAEGTSRRYRVASSRLDEPARGLWQLVRAQVEHTPQAAQDTHRLQGVLSARRSRQAAFFESAAARWDTTRGEMIGQRTDLLAMLSLLDPATVIGDLGCGTGHVAEALTPCVARVVAVDESEAMLATARARLAGATAVDFRVGALEQLPVADGELDAAVMMLVAHYLPDPALAIAEASRVLRDGGRFVLVDLLPHGRAELAMQMEHLWQGFERDQVVQWMSDARFTDVRYRALPADPEARGPALFVASATKLG